MPKKRGRQTTPKTIPMEPPTEWMSRFQSNAMRTSFCLSLTQPMLEMLCAIADNVDWDRTLYYRQYGLAKPDNWMSSSQALIKRGLIYRKSAAEIDDRPKWDTWEEACEHSCWRLTPAGEALVHLLKTAGIFVEADAAIAKRAKRRNVR